MPRSSSRSARGKGKGSESLPSSAAAATAARPTGSSNDIDHHAGAGDDDDNTGNAKHRMQQQMDSLHQEMEVAQQYGVDVTGHNFRKKLSKKQRTVKNRKRKSLEQQDLLEEQTQNLAPEAKRLRGSRASFEDDVIQGSLVILPKKLAVAQQTGDVGRRDNEIRQFTNDDEDDDEEEEEEDADDDDSSQDAGEEDAGLEGNGGVGDGNAKATQQTVAKRNSKAKTASSATTSAAQAKRPRRKGPFRMRNFKSIKLAEQHGEALDAHTRGRHREAIQILKQIAREAPSAPQVYSSLGMVYCDMLREAREGMIEADDEDLRQRVDEGSDMAQQNGSVDALQAEVLDLAKKAYGAYHVSAVLCKKDFALWVRAADLACEVADLHSAMATRANDLHQDHHRAERLRWLNEARNDYQTADSLRPPGIDIPAKLATVSIELGQLSEALTLLTDLKNRQPMRGETTFETSYKAWWLYADLMLVIGRECGKWSRGDESNSNYMFRRWLRKHAKSFDWKVRRLQALVKALEVATGSHASQKLVDWLKARDVVPNARRTTGTHVTYAAVVDQDEPDVSDDGNLVEERDTKFAREKLLLEARCRDELLAFDKTSAEMVLELGQEPHKQRQEARELLLHAQKMALDGLTDEFQQMEPSTIREDVPPLTMGSRDSFTGLPMCVSLKTAIDIALELMRFALEMGEYKCGVLAGNVLLSYMKERAALRRRMEDHYQLSPAVMVPGSASGYHSDSEGSSCHFSDDDDIAGKPGLLEVMEKGILPAAVSVLLGCCLAGQPGANFLAFKRMESLKHLPHDMIQGHDWTGRNDAWIESSHAERGAFDRDEGFALVARTLSRLGKTKDFAAWLAPLFNSHVELLTAGATLDIGPVGSGSGETMNKIVEVSSASAMFLLENASTLVEKSKYSEAREVVLLASNRLAKLIKSIWCIRDQDMSLSPQLVELLKRMEVAARLSLVVVDEGDISKLFEPIQQVIAVVGRFSKDFCKVYAGAELPCLSNGLVSSAWLSKAEGSLALLAYNLCVATNVSCFSGWENEKFNFSLIRRRTGPKHFGITISDGLVFGVLRSEIGAELLSAWDLIAADLPGTPSTIREKLAHVYKHESARDGIRTQGEAVRGRVVGENGESESLQLLIHFAKMCLLYARGKESAIKRSLSLVALSILIPPTQFCVDEQLWDSEIGRLDEPNAVPRPLQLEALLPAAQHIDPTDRPAPSKQQGYIRRNRRGQSSQSTTNVLEYAENKVDSSLIVISCQQLFDVWSKAAPQLRSSGNSPCEKMAELNFCLHTLRRCSSEAAVEKASLNVAAALINIAADAHNPFVCLEQAARFASKAPKRGTSDLSFQERLPEEHSSTPLDALIILGRADCLSSVFFCEEAAFLCNFVASLFRTHNDETTDSRQRQHWDLVGIKAYNVWLAIQFTSARIRRTNAKMPDYQALNEALPIWRELALALADNSVDGVSKRGAELIGKDQAQTESETATARGFEPDSPREPLDVVEV